MRRRKQGFVYIASLLFITVLTVIGTSMLVRSVSESSQSERFANQSIALHVADAGVDQAARNLRTPTDLTDDITTSTLSTGTFTLDTPVSLGANTWKVVSHGFSAKEPTRKRNIEAVYSLTPQSVFQFALFGGQSVAVSGNATTDSYDSRLGSYGSQTPAHNGDVGTNSTSVGGVNVEGSIFVDGQVVVGPNVSNPTSLVAGYDPAFITGGTSPPTDTQDVVSNSGTFPLPAVVVPDGMTCNDFTVQGNTNLVLPPGTYCYRNLTIQGNANMASSGQATVYVPVLVLVEIAEAARRGVLRFDYTFSHWVDRLLAPGRFVATDLTLDIVLAAERFSAIPERGDRLIAATAAHLECPLITKDARLARIPGLRTMW